MIRGWDEGVAQLSKGERAKLTISPDYGYGARGAAGVSGRTWRSFELLYWQVFCVVCTMKKGANVDLGKCVLQVIPPNATLIFDVELLSFQ